mmetsp:Transcript_61909/g.91938  ORF Transcript_61909/g.91938 Transcript_61909/m.91938 type:complete len:86 (-) Transcript_61909:620-877(-)
MEEMPSVHTCSALFHMIKTMGSRLQLDKRSFAKTLMEIVQKGSVGAELASYVMKTLLALQRTDSGDMTMAQSGNFICVRIHFYCS